MVLIITGTIWRVPSLFSYDHQCFLHFALPSMKGPAYYSADRLREDAHPQHPSVPGAAHHQVVYTQDRYNQLLLYIVWYICYIIYIYILWYLSIDILYIYIYILHAQLLYTQEFLYPENSSASSVPHQPFLQLKRKNVSLANFLTWITCFGFVVVFASLASPFPSNHQRQLVHHFNT